MSVKGWKNAHQFQPMSMPRLEMDFVNEITRLGFSWPITIGDISCTIQISHEGENIREVVFLYFQCGEDMFQIALEDLSIVWLHKAMEEVVFSKDLPNALVVPMLKQLLNPLEKILTRITGEPVRFIGHFYEPVDAQFECVIPFVLKSSSLTRLKENVGLRSSTVRMLVYFYKNKSVLSLLQYLRNIPKKKVLPLALPVKIHINAGYSILPLGEVSKIKKDSILFPYDYPVLRKRVVLNFLNQSIPCAVVGKKIQILDWQGIGSCLEPYSGVLASDSSHRIRTRHLKKSFDVTVFFDLGQEIFILKDILQFVPGYTLAPDVELGTFVTIRIQNKAIAIGEHVKFASTHGIRVVEMLDVIDE